MTSSSLQASNITISETDNALNVSLNCVHCQFVIIVTTEQPKPSKDRLIFLRRYESLAMFYEFHQFLCLMS